MKKLRNFFLFLAGTSAIIAAIGYFFREPRPAKRRSYAPPHDYDDDLTDSYSVNDSDAESNSASEPDVSESEISAPIISEPDIPAPVEPSSDVPESVVSVETPTPDAEEPDNSSPSAAPADVPAAPTNYTADVPLQTYPLPKEDKIEEFFNDESN